MNQVLFFLSGTGKVILDGKEPPGRAGDVVVVTPGTRHNFINDGREPLEIYPVYAPPKPWANPPHQGWRRRRSGSRGVGHRDEARVVLCSPESACELHLRL